MCIKYIEHECLVCYSYLSKTGDRGSVVGSGECNYRTKGDIGIRADDIQSKI